MKIRYLTPDVCRIRHALPEILEVQLCGLQVFGGERRPSPPVLERFGLERRRAIWAAGPAAAEQTVADLWITGVTTHAYPTELLRPWLDQHGALTSAASG